MFLSQMNRQRSIRVLKKSQADNKKSIYLTICLALALGLFCHSSFALHRIDLLVPQTRTLEQGQIQVSVERKATVMKKAEDNFAYGHESTQGTSFGIWQKDRVGVEGGIDWTEPASENLSRGLFGHLRVSVNDVEEQGWAVAVGLEKFGFVANKNDFNIIYINLQNRISELWYVGVGGYNGSSKFLINHRGKADPRGTSVGIWRQIQRGQGKIGLEYQSGMSFMGMTVLGMTLTFTEGVYGTIGYGIANNQRLVRDWMLTKIAVDF